MTKQLRIASLLSAATEILYGLGLGEQVVAVSHECDFPPEVQAKPRVTYSNVVATASSAAIDDQVRTMTASGSPLYAIDIDQLLELQPDVIVTQAQCDVCAVRYQDVMDAVQAHPRLGTTTVIALNPESLEDVFGDICRIGTATGRSVAADDYVAQLRGRVDDIRKVTTHLPAQSWPRVACIEWIEPIMLAGNWVPELISMAGGRPGLTTPGQHSPYVSWQRIADYNPQVIVVSPCGFDLQRTVTEEAAALSQLAGWQDLAAVRERQVYAIDGNAYLNRSGPRLVDTIEILAHLFHPRCFARPTALGTTDAWQVLN